MTARSLHSETPRTFPLTGSVSFSPTNTSSDAAPVTTWLLVTTMPDGSMIAPEPEPAPVTSATEEMPSSPGSTNVPLATIRTMAGWTTSTSLIAPPVESSSPASEVSLGAAVVVPAAAGRDERQRDEGEYEPHPARHEKASWST